MAGKGGIPGLLWQGKFYIFLVLALLVVLVFGAYYYVDSRQLSSLLDQKTSDYNSLNDVYGKLSNDHSALVNSNNDLILKYNNVSDRYNRLYVDNGDLQSSYNGLKSNYDGINGTISRFQETGGAVIALHYDFYQSGPSNNVKNYLEATVYNVGNKKIDTVTIKGRIDYPNNTTGISQQTFTNVDPLDKRHVKWDYNTSASLDSVWYET